MWSVRTEVVSAGQIHKVFVLRRKRPLSYLETVRLWQNDPTFRNAFTGFLAETPFPAYFWETPPVTSATASRPFEFVLVNSPSLPQRRANPRPFESHFAAVRAGEEVVTFSNLGRDAHLVAPCPLAPATAYPHLAAFARHAPKPQQHAFWRAVSAAVEERLGSRHMWLSTSGLGVAWLHVRLDDRPKYYSFRPYRSAS